MKRLIPAVIVLTAGSLLASGSEPMPQQPMQQMQRTPEQEAVDAYNAGLRARDKALKLLEEAKTADAKRAQKNEDGAKKQFERAKGYFERAIVYNPRLFQAHGELGFALRKLGRYDESLAAYEKSLAIQPNYSLAIEYRAEAYLALDRFDEAKDAYLILFNGGDRPRADLLFNAMSEWVQKRRAEPGNVATDKLDAVAKWLDERKAIHAQTGALYRSNAPVVTW
ncbi:MAG TPA: tetratricopeptide repeat protein [Thermoanaerobaculia bacterium]|nr:tetratricopeptide repeat protein [Thermoanaerobaculia bacterium]